MKFHPGFRLFAAALLLFSVTSWSQAVLGQVVSSKVQLPQSVRLSDVEIRLTTGHGDGCVERCVSYRITVHGAGLVELEDLGDQPRAETQRRSIAVDQVVTLVNEFLGARFFDALDGYDLTPFMVRSGDELLLRGRAGAGSPWVDITLRLAAVTKTVRLNLYPVDNVPAELEKLKDLVWRIGGPEAWPAR